MSQRADLVIIGISVGLALGILIAILVFYVIRWYRKNAYLRRSTNEHSLGTIQIRTNGLDASTEFSASLSGSIAFRGSEKLHKDSWSPWRNHHHKDIVASASGVLKYPYKDIQKATENFTTLLGQGSYGPVYKAKMPNAAVVAVKVLASDSKQGEKEFQTEVRILATFPSQSSCGSYSYTARLSKICSKTSSKNLCKGFPAVQRFFHINLATQWCYWHNNSYTMVGPTQSFCTRVGSLQFSLERRRKIGNEHSVLNPSHTPFELANKNPWDLLLYSFLTDLMFQYRMDYVYVR